MNRRIGAARLAWRSATTTPTVSVLVILVVALVSFAGTAAPGLLQAAQTTMLRYALSAELPAQRDFSDAVRGMPPVGAGGSDAAAALPESLRETWGRGVDQLAAIGRLAEPRLAAVLGDPRLAVGFDVATAVPQRNDAPRTRVILTLDPRLDERIELVSGAAPAAVVAGEPIEILLLERVAEQTGWQVGEVRTLDYPHIGEVPVRLSGIARALDEGDSAWSHVPTSLRADVRDDGSRRPSTPESPSRTPDPSLPSSRWQFRPSSRSGSRSRWIGSAPPAPPSSSPRCGISPPQAVAPFGFVSASAPSTLVKAEERVAGVAAVIAVAASGPVAVAVVVLVLAARLLAVRRRTTVVLAGARGASRKRMIALLGLEGLVLGVVGGILGAIAGASVGHSTGPLVVLAPLLVALIPAIALPVLGLTLAGRRGRVDEAARHAGPWRPIAEVALVALAVIAVVLTLTAGTEGDGPTPLVVLLPVLLAAAGCVAALRLTPMLLKIVGRGARTTRGLVPLLGPARAERDPAVGVAPVLAIVVGTAIAVFSSGFLATVASGTDAAARVAIGADIRVTAPYFTQDQLDAVADLDGVAASAPVYADTRVLVHLPRADANITVFVIDAEELRAVQGDRGDAFPVDALAGDRVASFLSSSRMPWPSWPTGRPSRSETQRLRWPPSCPGRRRSAPRALGSPVDRAYADQFVFPSVLARRSCSSPSPTAHSVGRAPRSLTDLLGAASATTIPQDLAAGPPRRSGLRARSRRAFSPRSARSPCCSRSRSP